MQSRSDAGKNYTFKHRGVEVAQCRFIPNSQQHQKWVWSIHVWVELKGTTEPLQTGGYAGTLQEAFEHFCETFERIKAMPGFDIKRVRGSRSKQNYEK
jgi:hypothetical protein